MDTPLLNETVILWVLDAPLQNETVILWILDPPLQNETVIWFFWIHPSRMKLWYISSRSTPPEWNSDLWVLDTPLRNETVICECIKTKTAGARWSGKQLVTRRGGWIQQAAEAVQREDRMEVKWPRQMLPSWITGDHRTLWSLQGQIMWSVAELYVCSLLWLYHLFKQERTFDKILNLRQTD